MFKKLLALAAVALVGYNMDAKTVVDMHVDWTARSWNGYVMGYIPQTNAEEGLIFEWPHFTYQPVDGYDEATYGDPSNYEVIKINGADNYIVPTADGGPKDDWGIQAHLLPENLSAEIGTNYTVTVYAKSSKDGATLGLPLSWNWSGGTANGSVQLGEEWGEYTLEYADPVGGASCWMVGQMYDKEARICIKWVEISHNESDAPVVEDKWDNILVNGDAEGEYGDVPCVYTKEYGYNNNEPHPAIIEEVDGNKVFVCHAAAVDPNDFLNDDGEPSGAHAWQNQIWIQSPKSWKKDDSFRISFRYKASQAANTNTQCHKETPGDYLIWHAIGDVKFTTDWQEFTKVVTVEADMAGMYSVAFNLNPDVITATDFYMDDVKWEVARLEEGFFCAEDISNVNAAVEFGYDEVEDALAVVVGVDTPCEAVKISTVRGRKTDFNNNTIIPAEKGKDLSSLVSYMIEEEEWAAYVAKSGQKITFPEPGCYKIMIDSEAQQMGIQSVDPSGVASVAVDNSAAVYYNLQGVQVQNPINGQFYIVKKGNKVSKTIVR